MFKKIKYYITFIMITLMLFGGIGCQTLKDTFSKQYTTESGKVLSSSFGNIYQFNNLSKDLYDIGLKMANVSYENGVITDEQVKQIIEKAKIYKDLQILGSQSIISWYDAVDKGEDAINKKEIALSVLTDLVKNGQEFATLLETLSNGKIQIPEGIIPTMSILIDLVIPVIQ